MADPEQIEQELRGYLETDKQLRQDDKLRALMGIFNKHFGLDKIDHVINAKDISNIVDAAKVRCAQASLPLRISNKEMDQSFLPHVSVIEAFVSYANKNKLLKKLVNFDYRY